MRLSFRYLAIIEFFVVHPGEFDERPGYTLFGPDMGEYVALANAQGCGGRRLQRQDRCDAVIVEVTKEPPDVVTRSENLPFLAGFIRLSPYS